MKMCSNLMNFIKIFHKFCTFIVIFKDNAAINCITVQHIKDLFPSTLTGHTTLVVNDKTQPDKWIRWIERKRITFKRRHQEAQEQVLKMRWQIHDISLKTELSNGVFIHVVWQEWQSAFFNYMNHIKASNVKMTANSEFWKDIKQSLPIWRYSSRICVEYFRKTTEDSGQLVSGVSLEPLISDTKRAVAVTKFRASRPWKNFTPLPRGSKSTVQRC
jgi:hypothetical protein